MDMVLHRIMDLLWANKESEIDFCTRVGINRSAVTSWKKGEFKSYMNHLDKIADHFGVTVEYLRTGGKTEGQIKKAPVLDGLTLPEGLTQEKLELLVAATNLPDEDLLDLVKYVDFLRSKRAAVPQQSPPA